MRTRILQSIAVLAMGVLALTAKPRPLGAEKAAGGECSTCQSGYDDHWFLPNCCVTGSSNCMAAGHTDSQPGWCAAMHPPC